MIAGSEDGVPHIWDVTSGDAYGPKFTRNFECRFLDLVSDISWNPKYNMFALSGFGHTFPVMVYVYERSEEQLNEILYQTAGVGSSTGIRGDFIFDPKDDTKLVGGGATTNKMSSRMRPTLGEDLGGKENEHVGRVNVSQIKPKL